MPRQPKYATILEKIFTDRHTVGATLIEFERADIRDAAEALDLAAPKNLGDLVYSFRFRALAPDAIAEQTPEGSRWVLRIVAQGRYALRLEEDVPIAPNPALLAHNIPDATPEVITQYRMDDEQALLAIIRYNRLIDTFLSLTAYSLQNHLRTTVGPRRSRHQIEIDELYVAIDARGGHYVVPVQAKSQADRIEAVQAEQDLEFAREKYPLARCRPVAAQFIDDRAVALFELQPDANGVVRIAHERHYRLVPASAITDDDIGGHEG